MKDTDIQSIFGQFEHQSDFLSLTPLTSGHINDTYLVKTTSKPFYILQRINHSVFQDVPGLVNNKVSISQHLQAKTQPDRNTQVLTFVKSKNNHLYYHQDQHGNYWNMMIYIEDSHIYETVTDKEIAYQGGKLLGDFLNMTDDFDASQLIEVIPHFHDMSFRYQQYEDALNQASKDRLEKAKNYTHLVAASKDDMHILQTLKESGKIPLRVTHNDTKISNTLFDQNNKGLCVIDTDTVMPGIVHYDFGDAIRTICNSAAEDEKDLNKVHFNLEYYNAYLKGFLEEMQGALSPLEIKYLPLAAKTMTFIMGLRFLTDYLNHDIYYKTKYDEHNLVRAKNQFKLIESLSAQFDHIES